MQNNALTITKDAQTSNNTQNNALILAVDQVKYLKTCRNMH